MLYIILSASILSFVVGFVIGLFVKVRYRKIKEKEINNIKYNFEKED